MPTFEISLDDGRKFHVEAVDQKAAQAGIQQFLGQTQNNNSGGGIADAAKAGLGGLLSGVGETGQRYLGVGKALSDAGNSITPQNAPDTTLYDKNGFHPGNIPNALAESSPSVAAAIAAARLMPGPLLAKLLAAGGVGLASTMGNFAKEATAKRTGDANAPSNTEDLMAGATRALPEAAIQALPISRFLPTSAARLGLKGVVGSLGRTAADAAGMGAASAGANVYDQATQNGNVDPNQALDALAKGAVTGGAFGAGRTVQDAKAAIKYRGIADADPTHIAEAANRIQSANENLGGNLSSTRDGYDALRSAQTDVSSDLKNTVKTIKTNTLSPEAANALTRAQKGLPLGEDDIAALNQSAPSAAVTDLQRLSGVARVLQGVQETGSINEAKGTFTGGLSGKMGEHVRALANPLGAGVSAALASTGGAHLGDAFAHSPEALAALAGAYGLARFTDWASGNRSPAKAFANRFATSDAVPAITPAQIGTGAGQDALDAMANRPGPTGPSIAQIKSPWGPPPQQAPQLPPQAPQLPQLNPIAMRMLKAQMANPPQAPEAPAPQAPQLPQFNPIAMRMLAEKLRNPPVAENVPVIPAQAAANTAAAPAPVAQPPVAVRSPAALVPAITKLTKSNGKVKAETKPTETAPQAPAAPPAQDVAIPEDLSIPDFLKRTPAAPQVDAAKALSKMNGKLPLNLTPDVPHTAEDLALANSKSKDFATGVMSKYDTAYIKSLKDAGAYDKTVAAIERRVEWKKETADKLSQLVPGLDRNALFHKLMGTDVRAPIRALRSALLHNHPDKASTINSLLSETQLEKVWKKVGK